MHCPITAPSACSTGATQAWLCFPALLSRTSTRSAPPQWRATQDVAPTRTEVRRFSAQLSRKFRMHAQCRMGKRKQKSLGGKELLTCVTKQKDGMGADGRLSLQHVVGEVEIPSASPTPPRFLLHRIRNADALHVSKSPRLAECQIGTPNMSESSLSKCSSCCAVMQGACC